MIRFSKLARTCLAAVVFLATNCAPAPETNLLLLVSDTFRADALDCAGHRDRTPNLCALSDRGVVFENAYAGGPWTFPSTVALFSGTSPVVYARESDAPKLVASYWVPDDEVLLAEALRDRGYRTAGFFENGVALRANVGQGIEAHGLFDGVMPTIEFSEIPASVGFEFRGGRNTGMLPLLYEIITARRPYFLIQWMMDPHSFYEPPEAFLEGLTSEPMPRPLSFYVRLGNGNDPRRGIRNLAEIGPTLSAAELALLVDLYHREVRSVDERIGYVLRALEATGAQDRTVIVFTSDHGEGFGEHGGFLHGGRSLHDEFVRVPLVVAGPGVQRGARVVERVSAIDLMPTLAEWFGVDALAHATGRSLAAALRGRALARPEPLWIVDVSRQNGHEAVIDGDYKLIRRPDGDVLYDLASDPDERVDLAKLRPEVVTRMSETLGSLRAGAAAHPLSSRPGSSAPAQWDEWDAETVRQLEALGYLDDGGGP